MSDMQPPPYTAHSKRESRFSIVAIGGLFLLTVVVFGILFGAGTLIHGS